MAEPETTPTPQPDAAPAGLWLAFWPLLAAVCCFFAAEGTFYHDGPPSLLNGGLALVAMSVTLLIRHWQNAVRRGDETPFARLTLGALIPFGFALWFATWALLLALLLTRWRGIYVGENLIVWNEGIMGMALLFALVFAAAGLTVQALHSRLRWSNFRYGALTFMALLPALLAGPTLTVEVWDGSGLALDQRQLYIKYSLLRMLTSVDDIILRPETLRTGDQEPRTIVCVGQETTSHVIFGTRSAWAEMPSDPYIPDPAQFKERADQCAAETQAALDSGAAIEGALYTNQLGRFFGRVKAAPEIYRDHRLAADIDRLPEPLKSSLAALLPTIRRWNYTAFDVALAVGDKEAIKTNMPALEYVLPHQRQALFALGLNQPMEGVAGETSETLAAKREEATRSQVNLAARLGDPSLMKLTMYALLASSGRGDGYSEFRGGYSEFDYFMANRHCDVAYAKFLASKKIQPTTQHVLHLLAAMGHAQYPGILIGSYDQPFSQADNSLGLPAPAQLKQCVELAAFYGATVKDFNQPHPELAITRSYQIYPQTSYDAVYRIAADAVSQWSTRNYERNQPERRPVNTSVEGDPALLVNAAAEFLKAQPPSFEQYCAWANTAHTWLSYVKDSQPGMVKAMQTLPEQWRNAKVVYKSPDASCNLNSLYTMTDEYQHPKDAAKYLNAALARVGIPCQGQWLAKENQTSFTCKGKTEAWMEQTP